MLAEGNIDSIIDEIINISRGLLKTRTFSQKLLRNSIFYGKIVGTQNGQNNPCLGLDPWEAYIKAFS